MSCARKSCLWNPSLRRRKRRQELAPPARDGEMNRVNITLRQKVQSRRAAWLVTFSRCVASKGGSQMKTVISTIVGVALAIAFIAPAVAAEKTPKTQAACEKAKMKWDATSKTCSKGSM